jgi:hypothetical protein
MSQFEQWDNFKFCQQLLKSTSKMFQMIKQVYGEEGLGHICTNVLHKGKTVWKIMSISVSQKMVRTELMIQGVVMLVPAPPPPKW